MPRVQRWVSGWGRELHSSHVLLLHKHQTAQHGTAKDRGPHSSHMHHVITLHRWRQSIAQQGLTGHTVQHVACLASLTFTWPSCLRACTSLSRACCSTLLPLLPLLLLLSRPPPLLSLPLLTLLPLLPSPSCCCCCCRCVTMFKAVSQSRRAYAASPCHPLLSSANARCVYSPAACGASCVASVK
jgi:hypothetical protein